MALTVPLIVLAVLLSLMESPASAPVHRGRGGWTLNSAGYLLGPVLHPPSRAEGGGKGKTALGILDLWKAIDLGKLCKNVPKEKDALPSYMPPNFRSKLPPRPQILLKP